MEMFVNVVKVNKLTRGTAKLIHFEGVSIAVFNADGAFFALKDACPFDGASLSDGWVTGSVLECRGDRARFFLPTGECLGHLKGKNIRSFRVSADKEHVFVDLRQTPAAEKSEDETVTGLWPVVVAGVAV
jgi:3-phenylpropionate/trans-cinnamate dioxygenase ferredoxin component